MPKVRKEVVSKAEQMRRWGLPANFQWRGLRYKNPPEKGAYWYHFALWTRKRDVERFGTCISCGKLITLETCDAGHFMPAKDCGPDLLFEPRNVNAECKGCNGFDEAHLLGYAENLDKRYGAGTAVSLRNRRAEYKASKTPHKEKKGDYYLQKIRELGINI